MGEANMGDANMGRSEHWAKQTLGEANMGRSKHGRSETWAKQTWAKTRATPLPLSRLSRLSLTCARPSAAHSTHHPTDLLSSTSRRLLALVESAESSTQRSVHAEWRMEWRTVMALPSSMICCRHLTGCRSIVVAGCALISSSSSSTRHVERGQMPSGSVSRGWAAGMRRHEKILSSRRLGARPGVARVLGRCLGYAGSVRRGVGRGQGGSWAPVKPPCAFCCIVVVLAGRCFLCVFLWFHGAFR